MIDIGLDASLLIFNNLFVDASLLTCHFWHIPLHFSLLTCHYLRAQTQLNLKPVILRKDKPRNAGRWIEGPPKPNLRDRGSIGIYWKEISWDLVI